MDQGLRLDPTTLQDKGITSKTSGNANPAWVPHTRRSEATCMMTVTGGTAVALSVVCLPFVLPAVRRVCLPYVPATATQIRNVMHALAGRSGRLVDLGSGDGRIVS